MIFMVTKGEITKRKNKHKALRVTFTYHDSEDKPLLRKSSYNFPEFSYTRYHLQVLSYDYNLELIDLFQSFKAFPLAGKVSTI